MEHQEKSVTRSFRISESTFDAIEEESRRKDVSVNTMVNQILAKYAKFDRFEGKLQASALDAMKKLVESIPEDKIVEAAKMFGGGIAMRDLMEEMTGGATVEDSVQFAKALVESLRLEYGEVTRKGVRTLTVMHDYGRNFSLYFAVFFKTLCESVGGSVEYSIDSEAVEFEIKSGDSKF